MEDKQSQTTMIEYSIQKLIGEDDVSIFGTFTEGTELTLKLRIKRLYGVFEVSLAMHDDNDDNDDINIPFVFADMVHGDDIYTCSIKFNKVGLYFYKIMFGKISSEVKQITIYERDFKTPEWIKGGTMYQIFSDRFNKSEKHKLHPRKDCVMNSDWENGIPIYADKPGDPVNNNDFFGGSLYGIVEKLDYLSDLGVTCIYLNPIFKAHTNHKYDTGDYMEVDSMFGGDKALSLLIKEAGKHSIKIILDGVFNHTGDDSRYFNRYGNYRTKGAYQSKNSPYYQWYKFKSYPDDYECWWGVKILPAVDEHCKGYREFINGEKGVIRHYLKKGIQGWRLDVADELPEDFIRELRQSAKSENDDAIIIGEVWENASNKISYDKRRHYLQGNELDSVMNYPLRDAIIEYVTTGNCDYLSKKSSELYENYPKCISDTLMNILGTHDTERIMTILGGEPAGDKTNRELSVMKMSDNSRALGIKRLKLAYFILSALPGIPCIYYGDEIGMEGYRDPFNRRCYNWTNKDTELLQWYRKLGKIRKICDEFKNGIFKIIYSQDGVFIFKRDDLIIGVNLSDKTFNINYKGERCELLSEVKYSDRFKLEPCGCCIIQD